MDLAMLENINKLSGRRGRIVSAADGVDCPVSAAELLAIWAGINNFVDVLRFRAAVTPQRQAFGFLRETGTDEDALTYAELDHDARVIAAKLQQAGLAGERAVLLYQPGLDYIRALFGCLYAGAVAVPVYAPRMNSSYDRVRQAVRAARAAGLLSTDRILAGLDRAEWHDLNATDLQWLGTDNPEPGLADDWTPPALDGDTLAVLQFTSGSTGNPKGVMLQHRHLLLNSAMIKRSAGIDEHAVGVVWLPPYHDMGLIGGILQPIYSGFPMHLLSPYTFLQRPLRWLEAITRYRGTISSAPNFAYSLCANRIKPQHLASLDLSSWRVAANGAEPIRAETLARFARIFGACGFDPRAAFPCYGLAEATLYVSGSPLQTGARLCRIDSRALELGRFVPVAGEDGRLLVSSGVPAPEFATRIVDPVSASPCEPGRVGEIWLGGGSVAAGYWERPEETAETFRAQVPGEDGVYLRTGDLGCLHDGELYITGRIKDLIIIRGQNHYPHDIEATASACHPALRVGGSAAFSLETAEGEALGVVQEIERGHFDDDMAVLEAAIRDAVSRLHQLDIARLALVRPGTVPKTSSGKVKRLLCRQMLLDNELALLNPPAPES